MDSIELQEATDGHLGEKCQVSVSTGDVYTGIYKGYGESTMENPLSLLLAINKQEATRIGVPERPEIGVPYDMITSVKF